MRNISVEEEARQLLDLAQLLLRLGRRGRRRDPVCEMAEERALTPGQIHGVAWLGLDGDLTMGELAERLGVSEKTVTGIVDRLERSELAERCRRDTDRRVVQVRLTKKGRAAFKRMHDRFHRNAVRLLAVLDDEERKVLRRLLQRLIEHPEILGGKA